MLRRIALVPLLMLGLALLPAPHTAGSGVEVAPLAATPLGTSFTYQGLLRQGGAPANGTFDMTFGLFDVATGGAALSSQTAPGVPVANGLFTVALDFGAGVFTGDARWLEVTVAGTPLSPRQPVNAAPYALFARNDWSLTGNGGTSAGLQFVGTTDSQPLELRVNGARALRLEPNATSPNLVGGFSGNSVRAGVAGATIG